MTKKILFAIIVSYCSFLATFFKKDKYESISTSRCIDSRHDSHCYSSNRIFPLVESGGHPRHGAHDRDLFGHYILHISYLHSFPSTDPLRRRSQENSQKITVVFGQHPWPARILGWLTNICPFAIIVLLKQSKKELDVCQLFLLKTDHIAINP